MDGWDNWDSNQFEVRWVDEGFRGFVSKLLMEEFLMKFKKVGVLVN
jgi:hypothetical protein